MSEPTVTVAIPVWNEEAYLETCLDAVGRQTYGSIAEVLVIDGGSTDRTRQILLAYPWVRVLDNPRRVQSAALNVAIAVAAAEIFVRVDGHCEIADDYIERCVEELERTGAVMVGGAMTPVASGTTQTAIAAAMSSPIGAGPAKFHRGGTPGWVDTVYLGAYRTADARRVGGYSEDVGVNEDAEFAIRLAAFGRIRFTPLIQSRYQPRSNLIALARQFFGYGRGRARTVRRHPASLSARQLAVPLLLLGILSPWRRLVLGAYAIVVVAAAANQARVAPSSAPTMVLALPAMHLPWGAGFLVGLLERAPRRATGP